jgi:hypothetical protein
MIEVSRPWIVVACEVTGDLKQNRRTKKGFRR